MVPNETLEATQETTKSAPDKDAQISAISAERKQELETAIAEYLTAHLQAEQLKAQQTEALSALQKADWKLSDLAYSMDGVTFHATDETGKSWLLRIDGEPNQGRRNVTPVACTSTADFAHQVAIETAERQDYDDIPW